MSVNLRKIKDVYGTKKVKTYITKRLTIRNTTQFWFIYDPRYLNRYPYIKKLFNVLRDPNFRKRVRNELGLQINIVNTNVRHPWYLRLGSLINEGSYLLLLTSSGDARRVFNAVKNKKVILHPSYEAIEGFKGYYVIPRGIGRWHPVAHDRSKIVRLYSPFDRYSRYIINKWYFYLERPRTTYYYWRWSPKFRKIIYPENIGRSCLYWFGSRPHSCGNVKYSVLLSKWAKPALTLFNLFGLTWNNTCKYINFDIWASLALAKILTDIYRKHNGIPNTYTRIIKIPRWKNVKYKKGSYYQIIAYPLLSSDINYIKKLISKYGYSLKRISYDKNHKKLILEIYVPANREHSVNSFNNELNYYVNKMLYRFRVKHIHKPAHKPAHKPVHKPVSTQKNVKLIVGNQPEQKGGLLQNKKLLVAAGAALVGYMLMNKND